MLKKSVDLKTKRKCALLTLKWCKKNIGINNRRKTKLKVVVRVNFPKDEHERFIRGAYYSEDNKIHVYHVNCKTINDIIKTIIHEYTHYLQSMKKYWEMYKTHYYSTHPYERQADRNEEKYFDLCLLEILEFLY